MITKQMELWLGQFGEAYTSRNTFSREGIDQKYAEIFGVTRSGMNAGFLESMDRGIRILEVGCNIGMQLEILREMGFTQLYGIELQRQAVDAARQRLAGVDVIQGSAFDLPFRDGWFDLVYTSGVLIHIAPGDLPTAMREMVRCSKRFIWGFEYHADVITEVPYRDRTACMWKAPYAKLFQEYSGPLHLLKEEKYTRLIGEETGKVDAMYLLEKPQ